MSDTSAERAAREQAWREYADTIGVDYTAPTVRDDFDAGWRNCAAWQRERPVSEVEAAVAFQAYRDNIGNHPHAIQRALEAARRVGDGNE